MESPNVMDTEGSDQKFTGSTQFADLLTLPIKCRTSPDKLYSHKNKENNGGRTDVVIRNKPSLARGDSFKRPNSPSTIPLHTKRVKCNLFGLSKSSPYHGSGSPNSDQNVSMTDETGSSQCSTGESEFMDIGKETRRLSRSQSDSAIMSAMEKSDSDPLLVGDFSRPLLLPLITNGKHRDLKEIEASTLVDLVEGSYSTRLKSFKIIDCRFPYEYQGGRIKGAINLYTQKQIKENLMEQKTQHSFDSQEMVREVIIFHCEFSSKRAPELCRYLRKLDRNMNDFPWLHYPELYVLFGGYKNFFENYPMLCEPQEYRTMEDESFKNEYKLCKRVFKNDNETKKHRSSKALPRSSSSYGPNT